MKMNYDVNLNIHYSAPQEVWRKIEVVFSEMPYWEGCDVAYCWRGDNIDLEVSVEPGGLNICGEMPESIWNEWYEMLKRNLSAALGYEIGEPEDGFPFKYWEPFRKNYSDIKSIDSDKIVFNDFSTFFWNQFTSRERDITAKPPHFHFSSEYIALFIIFEESGLFSSRKASRSFHDFSKILSDIGINTRDLS